MIYTFDFQSGPPPTTHQRAATFGFVLVPAPPADTTQTTQKFKQRTNAATLAAECDEWLCVTDEDMEHLHPDIISSDVVLWRPPRGDRLCATASHLVSLAKTRRHMRDAVARAFITSLSMGGRAVPTTLQVSPLPLFRVVVPRCHLLCGVTSTHVDGCSHAVPPSPSVQLHEMIWSVKEAVECLLRYHGESLEHVSFRRYQTATSEGQSFRHVSTHNVDGCGNLCFPPQCLSVLKAPIFPSPTHHSFRLGYFGRNSSPNRSMSVAPSAASQSQQLEALLQAATKYVVKGGFFPLPTLRPDTTTSSTAEALPSPSLQSGAERPARSTGNDLERLPATIKSTPSNVPPLPSATSPRRAASMVAMSRPAFVESQAVKAVLPYPDIVEWFGRVETATSADGAALEKRLQSLRSLLDRLLSITGAVRSQGDVLAANARQLMAKRAVQEAELAAVTRTLKVYSDLDALFVEVSHPLTQPQSARFCAMLEELEAASSQLKRLEHYKSTAAYQRKVHQSYQHALGSLRDSVTAAFQLACTGVGGGNLTASGPLAGQPHGHDRMQLLLEGLANGERPPQSASSDASLRRSPTSDSTLPDAMLPAASSSSSVAPVAAPAPVSNPGLATFRTILALRNQGFLDRLQPFQPIVQMLEARVGVKLAAPFVLEAVSLFTEQRYHYVRPLMQHRHQGTLARLKPHEYSYYVATDCQELIEEETKLCAEVWTSNEVHAQLASNFLSELLDSVYHFFRSRLLRVDAVEDLSPMCETLQAAIRLAETRSLSTAGGVDRGAPDPSSSSSLMTASAAGSSLPSSTSLSSSLADECRLVTSAALRRMLQDTQERLIYRADVYVRQHIKSAPTSWDAVKDSVILASPPPAAHSANAAAAVSIPGAPSPAAVVASGVVAPSSSSSSSTAPTAAKYAMLEKATSLFQQLYVAVDRGVFTTIVDDAVQHVLTVIQQVEKTARGQSVATYVAALANSEATGATAAAAHVDEVVVITPEGSATTAPLPNATVKSTAQPPSIFAELLTGGGSKSCADLPHLGADLFVVRSLLQLRESLSSFDVNLVVHSKSIDLSQLLGPERKLDIRSTSRETKRDVETLLKMACEHFIERSIALIGEPFHPTAAAPSKPTTPLPQQPASTDIVAPSEFLLRWRRLKRLRDVVHTMLTRSLSSAPARGVLWRPVRANLIGLVRAALDRVNVALAQQHDDPTVPGDGGASENGGGGHHDRLPSAAEVESSL